MVILKFRILRSDNFALAMARIRLVNKARQYEANSAAQANAQKPLSLCL